MQTHAKGVLWALVLVLTWAPLAAASQDAPRVLFVMPKAKYMYMPRWMIGEELFPVVDELEAHGAIVDFTSPEAGPYSIPTDERETVMREIVVETTSDEIDLSLYDIVAIAGGHVHQYLTVLVEPNRSLLYDAYARGITLAGLSQGVLALNDSGLMTGRTLARCPWGHGIVYCSNSIPAFEQAGTEFSNECLVISDEIPGEPTVITATYDCILAFASALLEELGLTDASP